MSKARARKLKPIPKFRTEAEERRFWETRDSAYYLDWAKADSAYPPRSWSGSRSRPTARDVPYQSLIKIWLKEKMEKK